MILLKLFLYICAVFKTLTLLIMFKIGQKVVCIDNTRCPELVLNKIYIIDEIYSCPGCGITGLVFYSICKKCSLNTAICLYCNALIPDTPQYYSYHVYRFRSLEYNNCHDELLKTIVIEKLDVEKVKVKEKII
jgi:hypothetical protein